MAQLKMIWRPQTSPSLPINVKLKDGYDIRPLTEDMIDGWCETSLELTGGTKWSREEFISRMLFSPPLTLSPKYIYCAVDTASGRMVGTASACLDGINKYGNLHMVTVCPEYKGLGLGKAVCAAAVNAFIDNGITEADLSTDDFRIPAIAVYLYLGFRPFLYEESMDARWKTILSGMKLKNPVEAYDSKKNSAVIYSPEA
jgi:GNAT superfamily N-acetyltransferase